MTCPSRKKMKYGTVLDGSDAVVLSQLSVLFFIVTG